MERREHIYRVTIPAYVFRTWLSLEYYFEVKSTTGRALLHPWVCKKFDEPAVLCHTAVPQFIFTAMRLPLLTLLNHR